MKNVRGAFHYWDDFIQVHSENSISIQTATKNALCLQVARINQQFREIRIVSEIKYNQA